jgi:hypothetical protein
MPRDATPARTPHTGLLALVFLALLVQIYPLKLVAANRASGRFSPHCVMGPLRKGAPPLENVSQPRTQESGWTRSQKTNAFQENTMWISAHSILMEHSSLNTESKIGFAYELSGVPIEMLIAR